MGGLDGGAQTGVNLGIDVTGTGLDGMGAFVPQCRLAVSRTPSNKSKRAARGSDSDHTRTWLILVVMSESIIESVVANRQLRCVWL